MAADPILIIATQTRLAPARGQAGAIPSPAAARCRPAEAFGGFMVRDRARFAWQYLSCDSRQSACESARDCHGALLLVSLHSAQTKNTSMYFGGGLSGSYATSNRLGSGIG